MVCGVAVGPQAQPHAQQRQKNNQGQLYKTLMCWSDGHKQSLIGLGRQIKRGADTQLRPTRPLG